MIRILTELDRREVLEYLNREPAFNIFPIGDIETFGFDKDFQRLYADINEFGEYLSVFLRYKENAVFYTHLNTFNQDYLDIFAKDPFDFLSGKTDVLVMFEPYLKGFTRKQMHFCRAKKMLKPTTNHELHIKQLSTEEDCLKLYDLISQIEEFSSFQKDKIKFVSDKLKSMAMGLTYFIEENDKVISTVATTAETTTSAMVVAVATDPLYRNRGLATVLMKELMNTYLNNKKKELCLFYDNPSAGKIYLRLGFEYLGSWDMYKKAKKVEK
jgi:uncharacterized protein